MIAIEELRKILGKLENHFGTPRHRKRTSVLGFLINGILSQNTTDRNRDMASGRLFARFKTFESMARARATTIAELVRPAGLGFQRAETIKRALKWAKMTFGGYSLEPLRRMDLDEALQALSVTKGVGIKTAALVMLFECRAEIMPVDTHIARVVTRLGFASEKTPPDKIFHLLRPLIPKGKSLSAHLNLIRLGREICSARKPRCGECLLFKDCCWEGKKDFSR